MLHKTLISSDLSSRNLYSVKQERKRSGMERGEILIASCEGCEWELPGFSGKIFLFTNLVPVTSFVIKEKQKPPHKTVCFKVAGSPFSIKQHCRHSPLVPVIVKVMMYSLDIVVSGR